MSFQTLCGFVSTTSNIPLFVLSFLSYFLLILSSENKHLLYRMRVHPKKKRTDTLQTSVAKIIAETVRLFVLNLGVIIFP